MRHVGRVCSPKTILASKGEIRQNSGSRAQAPLLLRFFGQAAGKMRRRLFYYLFLPTFLFAQISLRAEMTNGALSKIAVLENNVAYLRVGEVEKSLTEELQSAQSSVAVTNKIAGTILDLRFAGGDDLDSERSAKDLLILNKLPLAILVNDETSGAAQKLAADLREARAGLIFGNSTELKPDIAIAVNADDEKKFFKNPFRTLAPAETNSVPMTNNLLSFIDHVSEADLVRERIKDGEQDNFQSNRPDRAPTNSFVKPAVLIIRDPVLARAVDLIKGLAIIHER